MNLSEAIAKVRAATELVFTFGGHHAECDRRDASVPTCECGWHQARADVRRAIDQLTQARGEDGTRADELHAQLVATREQLRALAEASEPEQVRALRLRAVESLEEGSGT